MKRGIFIAAVSLLFGVSANAQINVRDVKVRNETISTDRTIKSCGNVEFENVIVKAGVKLSIDAPGEVVFGPGFEMEIGAELEMN